jgi:hypothetical protein
MAEKKVTKSIAEDNSGVGFTFADGSVLTANLSELSDEMRTQLALHGLSQKIGDSYAGEDAENCETIAGKVWEQLVEGNWSVRTGGGAGPRISQLAEALSRATEESVQDCVAKIADMDDETKKSVRSHPTIKAHLAQIKLEKAEAEATKATLDSAGESFDFSSL